MIHWKKGLVCAKRVLSPNALSKVSSARGGVSSSYDHRRCRLLTFGEEASGVGFSPSVKKPKIKNWEEDSSLPYRLCRSRRCRLFTCGEEAEGCHQRWKGAGPFSSCHRRCRLCRNRRWIVKRRVLSKQDESSILRRWARLFPFAVGDRLLTLGEKAFGCHQRWKGAGVVSLWLSQRKGLVFIFHRR